MQLISFSDRISSMPPKAHASESRRDIVRDEVCLNREIQGSEEFLAFIGNRLVRGPAFSNGFLTVYCGVPIMDLVSEDFPYPVEYLDLLICQGQDAVMAVKIVRPEQGLPPYTSLAEEFRKIPGLSSIEIVYPDSNFFADVYWGVDNLTLLINQSIHPDSPRVRTSLCPIPSKLLKQLSEPCIQALVAKEVSGKKYWFPTEYGRSLGILNGFRMDKKNRVHSMLCCAEERLDALWQTVAWKEQTLLSGEIPFSQRITRATQGLPSDAAVAAVMEDMVRKFAEMPLSEYLRNDQEGLLTFHARFPEASTYQQAAACVDQSDDRALLDILLEPFMQEAGIPLLDRPMQSVLFAASVLSKSRYLTWQGEIFLHDYDPKGIAARWSCRDWIDWASTIIDKESNCPDLEFLIRFLVVKPFSMMNRQCHSNNV